MSDPGNDPTQVNVPAVGGPPPPSGPQGPHANDPHDPDGRYDPDDHGGGTDRWPYIVIAALLVVIIIGFGYLLLNDDDGNDNAAPGDTATTVVDDTATTVATIPTTVPTSLLPETTLPTSTAPATTVPAPSDTIDPAQCRDTGRDPTDPAPPAAEVFAAWTRTDTACAQELMTSGAFDILFARDGTDAQDQFQGCSDVADGSLDSDCAFTYEGGSTHYIMNFNGVDGWQVIDVTQVAD